MAWAAGANSRADARSKQKNLYRVMAALSHAIEAPHAVVVEQEVDEIYPVHPVDDPVHRVFTDIWVYLESLQWRIGRYD